MKAMVLCAGYGTRLGNLVTEIPKPMLPLGDRPILEYTLRHLARHGFHEVAVNLHFQSEVIRNYFGDGSRFHVRLVYSDEPELLGTAGGVKKMAAFLAGSDPFLVHYGDVVTDQDFTAMLHFHRENNALATLLVHQRENSNSIISARPVPADRRLPGAARRPAAPYACLALGQLGHCHLRVRTPGGDAAGRVRFAARHLRPARAGRPLVRFSLDRLSLRH